MLMEKEIEAALATAFRAVNVAGLVVTASREAAETGTLKTDSIAGCTTHLHVSVGLRSHDEFTTTTVSIGGKLVLLTRVEKSPDGAAHETAMDAIMAKLETWHASPDVMTSALSTSRFFAGELRLDGGNGKIYSAEDDGWIEEVDFTIRGSVKPATT